MPDEPRAARTEGSSTGSSQPGFLRYDAIVLGLGGMGSAACAAIAARGRRVLGIDQFARGHALGASSGRSRIIRKAYFEDPAYVPLLARAYELWFELQAQTGITVIDLIGLLLAGDAQSYVLRGARASAATYGVEIENLSGRALADRYPQLSLRLGEEAVLEAGAGMVYPEAAIEAHLAVAQAAGADLRFECAALGFDSLATGVRVHLAPGTHVDTDRLIICAGPWLGQLLPGLGLPLRVQRNVQVWFEPASDAYRVDRFPAFLFERPHWDAPLYGFPDYGFGLKAALHSFGDDTSPRDLDREIHASDIDRVKRLLDECMPGAAARAIDGKACMYTLTPDEHFIIDRHPGDDRIVLAGGFSGHGYKFCPVVGEICADLALQGTTDHPIGFLSLERFAAV